jgi:hypothetical protein
VSEDYFKNRYAVARELGRREAERENSSRWATINLVVQSAGVGRFEHDTPLAFPAPFLEEPLMVQGSGVIFNPDARNFYSPEGRAGVWSWVRNEKGFYTGCKVWTVVEYAAKDGSGNQGDWRRVKVQHWLVFQGVAIKDFGQEATDAAMSLTPRRVGF